MQKISRVVSFIAFMAVSAIAVSYEPLPGHPLTFKVNWGATEMSFREVSGLDAVIQPIAYRENDTQKIHVTKTTATGPGYITMRRGITDDAENFFKLLDGIRENKTKKSTVTITLSDERIGTPIIWTLTSAIPTKVETGQPGYDKKIVEYLKPEDPYRSTGEFETAYETITKLKSIQFQLIEFSYDEITVTSE